MSHRPSFSDLDEVHGRVILERTGLAGGTSSSAGATAPAGTAARSRPPTTAGRPRPSSHPRRCNSDGEQGLLAPAPMGAQSRKTAGRPSNGPSAVLNKPTEATPLREVGRTTMAPVEQNEP